MFENQMWIYISFLIGNIKSENMQYETIWWWFDKLYIYMCKPKFHSKSTHSRFRHGDRSTYFIGREWDIDKLDPNYPFEKEGEYNLCVCTKERKSFNFIRFTFCIHPHYMHREFGS